VSEWVRKTAGFRLNAHGKPAVFAPFFSPIGELGRTCRQLSPEAARMTKTPIQKWSFPFIAFFLTCFLLSQ
jgi:hypothetical protein